MQKLGIAVLANGGTGTCFEIDAPGFNPPVDFHVHIFNSSGCWYFSELSVENSGWLRE